LCQSPDAVTDDFSRKAVGLVTLGGGGRGHVWLPLCLPSDGSRGVHCRDEYVMGWEGWSTRCQYRLAHASARGVECPHTGGKST
jgi:hypothetical protein